MYKRKIFQTVRGQVKDPRKFIQVLIGPRQVGKTTISEQIEAELDGLVHYATADGVTLQDLTWVEQQWETVRFKLKQQASESAILILDEIQKIKGWSDVVKLCWDKDTREKTNIKVILLGSSPLLMEQGLTESLAGRFEVIPVTHWTYQEMHAAFNWTLEQFIYFGGYPGAADLIDDELRWKNYILNSLVETTISRDILLLTRVEKPALLRRLFYLGCEYSGQILSYQKMQGQLQDAGNTTTLAHYLKLLQGAGMLAGIEKYAGQSVRRRASSPKLMTLNTALLSANAHYQFEQAQENREYWGRLVESAIGAYLLNQSRGNFIDVYYWRERQQEVDFILKYGDKLVAIEVKSGKKREAPSGLAQFKKLFNPYRILLVGTGGIELELFLSTPITDWFG